MAVHSKEAESTITDSRREILARMLREKAADSRQEYPASPGQSALLFLHRLAPLSPAYNIAFVARVICPVDTAALQRALQRVVDRHDSLRTTYIEKDGVVCQVVHGSMHLELELVSAEGWDREKLDATVQAAFNEPYNLENGPVFRARLYTRSAEDHVILFGIHHIASDGWSQGIILNELSALYTAYAADTPCSLPATGMSYGESVISRQQALEGEQGRKLWEYWQKTMGGDLPVIELPTDRPRPAVPSMQGDSCRFRIGEACYQQLKALAKAEGVTFYTLVLASLQVLLMHYTGKQDITVGTPMAARSRPEYENVVGYFMNSVVIRGDLSGEPTFKGFLGRFKERVLGALSHQDYPFVLLVKKLCPEREASRSPVFQVMFNLQSRQTLGPFADLLAGEDSAEPVRFGSLLLKPFHLAQGAGAFDLILELIDTGSFMDGLLMFATDIFNKETVERMGRHFSTLLVGIAANPDQRITELSILPEQERRQLVDEWNPAAVSRGAGTCVYQLIRAQAQKTPDKTAVACDGVQLTYRELMERADRLALHLREQGAGRGQRVGIFMERSVDMVTAILGVLVSGAAYVPMDPAFPPKRIAIMLEDAGCVAVMTEESLLRSLPNTSSRILGFDELMKAAPARRDPPFQEQDPEDLAYVIYTSGSTGRPKGVEIPHRAVVNFLYSMQREPGITSKDTLLSVTTISFDIFGLEMLLPLVSGAKMSIATRNVAADGARLLRAMEESGTTMMQATPATWRLLLDSGWKGSPGLTVLCGGEALSRDLADRILDTGAKLWNMYGPTETTIWSAVSKVERGPEPISIGHPIDNTRFLVLDAALNLVPTGVPGELCIGGDGLARGYHNQEALTAQRFVADRFTNTGGAKLYRTGDLVRRRLDGSIEFMGRMDTQIKLRGYRIELGDIEHHLSRHPDVHTAVAAVLEDAKGQKRLAAYYVPAQGKSPSLKELREYLAGKLPDYMIPAAYVRLDRLPMTPNGKVDRKSLPKMEMQEQETGSPNVAPRDEMEKKIVQIWENVLGRRQISVRDNFFELGGDSLIAARIFAEIEKQLGKNIPLATLFRSPTVEELALSVRSGDQSSQWSIVVPMHETGTKTPLFLVHGAEGNILLYRSLLGHMGDDQPVYGLQSEGLDGRAGYQPTIEGMASTYIAAVKKIQPQGPYYFGGYCMGGVIALEMAQQMQRSGDKVAFLAMFETYNAQKMTSRRSKLLDFLFEVQNIIYHGLNAMSVKSQDRSSFLREKTNTELLRMQERRKLFFTRVKSILFKRNTEEMSFMQIARLNDEANRNYHPVQYEGRISLFRPKRQFIGYMDRNYGWEAIPRKGLQVRTLPIYPRGMLAEPFVRDLARQLSTCMQESTEQARS